MEEGNKQSFDSAADILPTLASLEQIVKSKAMCPLEECAVFRQQSILLKFSNEKDADDIATRNWIKHYSFDKQCADFHKELSTVYTNNCINVDFPNVDRITCTIDIAKRDEMFKEVCLKSNASENECIIVDKQINANMKHLPYKTRSPMDNFLNGNMPIKTNEFKTAAQILDMQSLKKCGKGDNNERKIGSCAQKSDIGFNFSAPKKSLGSLGRQVYSSRKTPKYVESQSKLKSDEQLDSEIASISSHPALKNVDMKMVEFINNEIVREFKPVDWNEIAGLTYAKSIIKEAVVYPLLRPDIFTGLRRPPKGILLFGPPGTGKTLIGKCIASQSSSTFFTISSASLTSKWMGEGEKMVRALFAVAVARQPSVIFIDEIDALLSQRSENENEGTRRLKTEFLVRLDGTSTSDDDRILIIGATNRPQELDEAVRRRFVKRLYVPLPEADARAVILSNLLNTVENDLDVNQIEEISKVTEGFSGADMDSLCREASMEPLRSLSAESIITYPKEKLRKINVEDFYVALKKIRPSVSQSGLNQLVDWNKAYGSSF